MVVGKESNHTEATVEAGDQLRRRRTRIKFMIGRLRKHRMSAVAVQEKSLLECRAIGKGFGGVAALDGVDFDLRPSEVHGVVGCNGAGKSTLMKILAGAHPDHDGSVLIDGREVSLSSPREAQACGIAMVYQELSGIGALSVAENLFLGRQPNDRRGTDRARGIGAR